MIVRINIIFINDRKQYSCLLIFILPPKVNFIHNMDPNKAQNTVESCKTHTYEYHQGYLKLLNMLIPH